MQEELGVILIVTLERRRRWAGEYPAIILALEQARGHRCARTDGLWIDDPAFNPVGLQAFARQKEIGRSGVFVMRSIAGRVTFKARRRGAGEQAARHVRFLGLQSRCPPRNIRKGLSREGRKQTY